MHNMQNKKPKAHEYIDNCTKRSISMSDSGSKLVVFFGKETRSRCLEYKFACAFIFISVV